MTLLSLLLVGALTWGAPAKNKKPKPSVQTETCAFSHLKEKVCSLKAHGIKVQVTESKISVYDGVWRKMKDFPYPGAEIEWDGVELRKFGQRIFLQIKLWDKPQGEVGIQSLLWMGYEIKNLQLEPKWREVLQKRTIIKTPDAIGKFERPKGQFEKPTKKKYLYDKPEKYSITLDKDGVLIWQVAHRKHSEKEGAPQIGEPPKKEILKKTDGKKSDNSTIDPTLENPALDPAPKPAIEPAKKVGTDGV